MNFLEKKYEGKFFLLDIPNLDISSRMLREWLIQGKDIRYYVPDSVYSYIAEQKLYR